MKTYLGFDTGFRGAYTIKIFFTENCTRKLYADIVHLRSWESKGLHNWKNSIISIQSECLVFKRSCDSVAGLFFYGMTQKLIRGGDLKRFIGIRPRENCSRALSQVSLGMTHLLTFSYESNRLSLPTTQSTLAPIRTQARFDTNIK